jgi:hypothetical protein
MNLIVVGSFVVLFLALSAFGVYVEVLSIPLLKNHLVASKRKFWIHYWANQAKDSPFSLVTPKEKGMALFDDGGKDRYSHLKDLSNLSFYLMIALLIAYLALYLFVLRKQP